MGYEYDWSVVLQPSVWLEAIYITLVYGIGTTVVGLILGLVLGLMLISSFGPARWFVQLFIGIFRCTPALIQILWFYYAFPIVLGINFPPWLAAGCGLTFYMAAFSAEIFRGGIQSIDKRQWSASRSLCMSYWQTMRHVILPQTFRRMTPAIVNQAIIQFKNTSLLSIVAVHDLMYAANALTAETYRPLEVFTFAAVIYIVIIWPLATWTNHIERQSNKRLS
ncbi:ABC transporter permease [Advenella kashmirensis W13003]|uniref:ABC transporter permease n=1 Tax=Advenella kashmirensis W13003 TaxID=1424334 RepID=V8QXP4_9BURK|nr:amino acid ABC transporter permease [Advenella kashmirensis]ETF03799.1 ABC transporter permease [Advenella kashmirensis W13003]